MASTMVTSRTYGSGGAGFCFEQAQRRQQECDRRHQAVQACVEEFATRIAGCTVHDQDGTLQHKGRPAKVLVVSSTSWSVQDTLDMEATQRDNTAVIVIVDGHVEYPAATMNVRSNAKTFVYEMEEVLTSSAPYCPAAARAVRPKIPTDPPLFCRRRSISYSDLPEPSASVPQNDDEELRRSPAGYLL